MDLKNRKKRKWSKTANFGHVLVYKRILNMFRLNFAVAVKLYFVHFLQIKMGGNMKTRGTAWNQLFL